MQLTYFASGKRWYGEKPAGGGAFRYYEFQCIVRGDCRPYLNEKQLVGKQAPALWIFPRHSKHEWRDAPNRQSAVLVAHFQQVPEQLETFLALKSHLCCQLRSSLLPRVRNIYNELQKCYKKPTAPLCGLTVQKCQLELILIACENIHMTASAKSTGEAKVEQAIEWYRHRLGYGPTVNDVAHGVFVSPTHLRRLFRQYRGTSPQAAFRNIRMDRAATLLEHTHKTLESISAELGFSELSAFSRAFRQAFRRSPSEFRVHQFQSNIE